MTAVSTRLKRIRKNNPIYEILQAKIIGMSLKPGERISENALAEEYGVGRGIIRDVVSQLSEERLVEVFPQRGTEISRLSLNRIRQAVYAHSVLEQALVKEICKKQISESTMDKIQQILTTPDESQQSDDAFNMILRNRQIQYLLMQETGREAMLDVYRTLDGDLLRVYYLQYSIFNYQVSMSTLRGAEHARMEGELLLSNIKAGNADVAALICSNHYNSVLWRADSLRGIYPQYFTD